MTLFALCFDAHRTDGRVWALLHPYTPDAPVMEDSPHWTLHSFIDVNVPTMTVYRGPHAEQPRAFLTGQATLVERTGETAVIR